MTAMDKKERAVIRQEAINEIIEWMTKKYAGFPRLEQFVATIAKAMREEL